MNKSVGGISEVAGSVTRFLRRSFNFAGVQTPTVCLEPLVCRLPPQPLRIPVRADTSPSIRLSGHSIAGTAAPNCTSFCADASEPDSLLPERSPTPDFRGDPLLFNDRELSFLRFQERVLEEARDETTPLLERVKFLAIVGTHLDDFVRVRAAEVRRNPARRMVVESMVKRLVYRVEVHWRRRMLPALRSAGIHIVDYRRLAAEERSEVDHHFSTVVRPLIAPLPYDAPHSLPHIASLGMNLMIEAATAAGDERLFVVRIPEGVPALVPFQAGRSASLESFRQSRHSSAARLRVARPSGRRATARAAAGAPRGSFAPIQAVAGSGRAATDRCGDRPCRARARDAPPSQDESCRGAGCGPTHARGRARRSRARTGRSGERRPPHQRGVRSSTAVGGQPDCTGRPQDAAARGEESSALEGSADILAAARERDILFHHPYESFQPIVEMIRKAADDPAVARISMTLYRTDRESPVVHALLDAVARGKQVRVLIELHARLDEHRNVNWWHIFEQAGAAVFPSPAGLKVHAKMALIERHEGGRLRRYAHLSSGNYNAFTARVYTDVALLTCDDDITADVATLFDALCNGTVTQSVSRADRGPTDHARHAQGAHRTGNRLPASWRARAHHPEDEWTGRSRGDQLLLPRVSGRCRRRLARAQHLLPSAGRRRRERPYSRSKHRRPVSGAQPRLVFPQRRATRRCISAAPI